MRIGLALPGHGPDAGSEALVMVSLAAEAMGYDSLWSGDPVLDLLALQDSSPGGGLMPAVYQNHMDPLTSLTFVAAHTHTIRVGTSTLNGVWHPLPLQLARALTTLDVLSQGRLDIGLGTGWMRDGYASVNVPWEGRGRWLDEMLDVLETCWSGEAVPHNGPLFTIPAATMGLNPRQRPRPPVLLGGVTVAALRRAGRRADGWLTEGMPLPYLAALWETVRKEAEVAGRDPSALRMVLHINSRLTDEKAPAEEVPRTGTLQQYVDYARAAAEEGVDELFIDLGESPATLDERVDLAGCFLEGVRPG